MVKRTAKLGGADIILDMKGVWNYVSVFLLSGCLVSPVRLKDHGLYGIEVLRASNSSLKAFVS